LAFCLADGTPLVSVDLSSERALEGSRIIELKEKALRKQKQRQQWWRVSSVMTMLIMTMVAYGVPLTSLSKFALVTCVLSGVTGL